MKLEYKKEDVLRIRYQKEDVFKDTHKKIVNSLINTIISELNKITMFERFKRLFGIKPVKRDLTIVRELNTFLQNRDNDLLESSFDIVCDWFEYEIVIKKQKFDINRILNHRRKCENYESRTRAIEKSVKPTIIMELDEAKEYFGGKN